LSHRGRGAHTSAPCPLQPAALTFVSYGLVFISSSSSSKARPPSHIYFLSHSHSFSQATCTPRLANTTPHIFDLSAHAYSHFNPKHWLVCHMGLYWFEFFGSLKMQLELQFTQLLSWQVSEDSLGPGNAMGIATAQNLIRV
jgi:hypothetical protein